MIFVKIRKEKIKIGFLGTCNKIFFVFCSCNCRIFYTKFNNKTQNGIEYKAKPTDDDEVYLQAIAETKIQKLHGGANYAINKAMGELCIGEALKTVFNQYRRHLKLASLVHYMILKQTPVMHYYEPFAKTHFMP